jgi:hypothetical protein
VKAIPAQATCSAPATSELDGIVADGPAEPNAVVTVVRLGGGHDREALVRLFEEPAGTDIHQSIRIRLVNAISSGESINLGYASSGSLPATVPMVAYPKPIPPGGVEPATPVIPSYGPVDAQGYLNASELQLSFGVVVDGDNDALFTIVTPAFVDTQSAFAIGDSFDATHPLRGLLCEDAATGGGDAGSVLASCTLSPVPDIVVDTFNVSLNGADSPFNDQRPQAIADGIAKRTSDLMCVLEALPNSTRDAIVKAAAPHFPYAYFVTTDPDTPATDATNAAGQVPPAPTGPPCAGVDPTAVSNIFQCTTAKCATPPDATGHIQTANCLSRACLFDYAALYQTGPQNNACFDCIIYYVTTDASMAHAQQACTMDPRPPLAFDGMNGTLMLSRYPLSGMKAYVLPATGYRRVWLSAEVQLGHQSLDFYCGYSSSSIIDSQLPYTGNYGKDGPSENGWEDEQDLQISKIVPWIQKTSSASGNRAILAGDWHSTIEVMDAQGGVVLGSLAPEVIHALDKTYGGPFTRADPAGYTPFCTYCPAPQNAYNTGGITPEDFTPTFLLGFPPGSTTYESYWATENVVTVTAVPYLPAPPGGKGPLSEYYGRSVHLVRPSR